MRNTNEYPITKDEILNALDWAIQTDRDAGLIGGITGAALQEARKIVEQSDYSLTEK